MNVATRLTAVRLGAALYPALLAAVSAIAQSATPVISLEAAPNAASTASVAGTASFEHAPANFRAFAPARLGERTPAQRLTLHFSAPTKLIRIESSTDFLIDNGTTCAEGKSYAAGGSCVLMARFTPQGAGRRLGKLTITHTASAQPMAIGLGGYGYAPVISFTPALMSTVPASHPGGVGILSSAQNLAVDGGDSLYIADTGNGLIRYMDSSGTIINLASGYAGALGVAVDTFGEVYFDVPSTGIMYEIYGYGPVVQETGSGSASCPASAPCTLSSQFLGTPGSMSIDSYNHLFFVDSHQGAAMSTVQPIPANLIYLYDPFPYQQTPSAPMAADAGDNLYSLWVNADDSGVCEIVRQTLFDAENSNVNFIKVAGGHTCGYSGDGGQAGNAEIGNKIGQITFDLAGNLYFSDTGQHRVRRIDAATGIISTVAGTGVAGYTGDGNSATVATLSSPTGVAVDSQGQVYIISGAATTGTVQLVRKLGPNGRLAFAAQKTATASAAKLVTVANTGNAALTMTKAVITGTNAGDFTVDPNTTSCILTAGATLNAGQSCKVGIVFKPAAVGARAANLVLLDNTVTNSNTVQLSGTGSATLTTKTALTSAKNPASVCTSLTFAVAVTGTGTVKPTGKVVLKEGTSVLAAANLTNGAAKFSNLKLNVGTNVLAARYQGDSANASSVSAPLQQKIVASGTCPAAN